MIQLNTEYKCIWPNGETKKVMVTNIVGDKAFVIWNEEHDPIKGCGCVIGLDDMVPIEWLKVG